MKSSIAILLCCLALGCTPKPVQYVYCDFPSDTGTLQVKFVYGLLDTDQQQVSVSGILTDGETGDPLPGGAVHLLGTNEAVATAIDGTFSLSDAEFEENLVFRYVGYRTINVLVADLPAVWEADGILRSQFE